MSDGGWVVLGAAIGTLGSISTTWLTSYLNRRTRYPKYDKEIEKILKELLNQDDKWKDMETILHVTGLTRKDAKEYMIEIRARGSSKNPELWGLIENHSLDKISLDRE